MSSIREQIDRLERSIAHDEDLLTRLERDVYALQQDLLSFKTRYDALIHPLTDRLRLIKSAIADTEAQILAHLHPEWESNRQTITVKDTAVPKLDLDPEADPVPPAETDLKKLYRELARRFHPDTDQNQHPDQQKVRTYMMAQINAAYAEKNRDALLNIARQVDLDFASLDEWRLHDLRERQAVIRERIFNLKQQKFDLLECDLMQLKTEANILASTGRDLLAEMATNLEQDYQILLRRLYDLRRANSP